MAARWGGGASANAAADASLAAGTGVAAAAGNGGSVADCVGSVRGWAFGHARSGPSPSRRRPRTGPGRGGCQALRRSAVTSISIFIAGSARPTCIMVAAGRISPKAARSTGQQGAKSLAEGSR